MIYHKLHAPTGGRILAAASSQVKGRRGRLREGS